MDYCRYLWTGNPLYRRVTSKVVAHFLTRLRFRGNIGSSKERREFEEFLREEIGFFESMQAYGEDWGCFGNGFSRLYTPFQRSLVDMRNDSNLFALSMFPEELVTFDLQSMTYTVPDPMDHGRAWDRRRQIKLTFRDQPSSDFSKIRVAPLDPQHVTLRFSESAQSSQVLYRYTPEFRRKIRGGETYEVNRTPSAVLLAVRANQDFLFDEGKVMHMRSPMVSGFCDHGWGMPEILAIYPQLHKIAVYDKIDETVGLDYLMPLRVMTPNLQHVEKAHAHMLSEKWGPTASRMISEQRMDRTRIHSFPFPVEYQELGGNGKALSPKDLKEFEVTQMLDAMGYPRELFQTSLNVQNIPTAIRLHESAYGFLQRGLSRAVNQFVKRISAQMFGESFDCTLELPSIADNLEKRGIYLNLMSTGDISRAKALEGLIDDPNEEKGKRVDEDLEQQELVQQKTEEAARRAQFGSLNNLVSGPQAGSGQQQGPVATPLDRRDEAMSVADQWLGLPTGQRNQAMQQVRATDELLYMMAKDLMDQKRRQSESQGRDQLYAQAQQAQGAG
jgi:hypothetical protein